MLQLNQEYFNTALGEYHRAEAMQLAQLWHGGMFTELYKLSSIGYVDDANYLLDEINAILAESSSYMSDDIESLDCLVGYAQALIAQEGIQNEL